ncbi:MAG: hypothetical protein QOE90_1353 [Thermoplasmata archaeon]|nr:hypothetical protein [Thermoplasmata archaeon]
MIFGLGLLASMDGSMTPPPAQPPRQPAWVTAPLASPHASPERPGGVTYAGVLAIVLGAIGCLWGLATFMLASVFSAIPFFGPIFAPFALFFGVVFLAMGALGIVAGAQTLQGQAWARWTLVALFAMGALAGISTLVVTALDVVAIVMLVKADATAWFESRQPRGVPVR